MIYRCTARFVRTFDALEPPQQTKVADALRHFQATPRMPTRDTHIIRGSEPEAWTLRVDEHTHLSFTFHEDPRYDIHYVCVFRQVVQTSPQ